MITMISITLYNATDIIKIVYGMNSPMVRMVHGTNGPWYEWSIHGTNGPDTPCNVFDVIVSP